MAAQSHAHPQRITARARAEAARSVVERFGAGWLGSSIHSHSCASSRTRVRRTYAATGKVRGSICIVLLDVSCEMRSRVVGQRAWALHTGTVRAMRTAHRLPFLPAELRSSYTQLSDPSPVSSG